MYRISTYPAFCLHKHQLWFTGKWHATIFIYFPGRVNSFQMTRQLNKCIKKCITYIMYHHDTQYQSVQSLCLHIHQLWFEEIWHVTIFMLLFFISAAEMFTVYIVVMTRQLNDLCRWQDKSRKWLILLTHALIISCWSCNRFHIVMSITSTLMLLTSVFHWSFDIYMELYIYIWFTIEIEMWLYLSYIDGLVQNCSNSSALAMELLQFCTKPSI